MIESVYLEALPGEFDVEDEFAGGVGAGVGDDDPDGVPRPAEEVLVARVRLFKTAPLLCGRCGQQAPRYDKGSGLRRWRGLDVGTMRSYLEAEAPRVNCPRHGPTVIAMPWARHGARHSRQFDQTVAWLMKFCAKAMLSAFLRIDWKTIGTMLTRVVKETDALRDRWDNVTRIGIDDVSYRRGRLYLMVVVNHDTGELLWAGPGRELATLKAFFDALGEERCKKIKLVSADGADFIANIVAHRLPNAKMCMDPYHVVVWANEALDLVRRRVVREARARGDQAMTKNLQKIRWALLKRPARLTSGQRHKLAVVQKINKHLYRAYLLKEQLRLVFRPGGAERGEDLDAWMRWAHRCKIPEFVELARRMRRYIPDIKNTLAHRLTNAVVEGLNSRIRLAISIARGFRNTDSLISLITLQLGGYCPDLPGRARRTVRLARS